MSDRLCLIDLKPIDRELPDPIPEGYELMWTEQFAGEALYCQKCFDESASLREDT